MLDLTRLNAIHVDAAERTVECGPGVRLREFDAACSAHRLAVTAGQNPDTGECAPRECGVSGTPLDNAKAIIVVKPFRKAQASRG